MRKIFLGLVCVLLSFILIATTSIADGQTYTTIPSEESFTISASIANASSVSNVPVVYSITVNWSLTSGSYIINTYSWDPSTLKFITSGTNTISGTNPKATLKIINKSNASISYTGSFTSSSTYTTTMTSKVGDTEQAISGSLASAAPSTLDASAQGSATESSEYTLTFTPASNVFDDISITEAATLELGTFKISLSTVSE